MRLMIAKVYCSILEETKIEPVAKKGDKFFFGHLFFEPTDEEVKEVLEEVEIPDSSTNVEIAEALRPLNEKYGMNKKSTFSTNAHWAWMNGLAENLDMSYIA